MDGKKKRDGRSKSTNQKKMTATVARSLPGRGAEGSKKRNARGNAAVTASLAPQNPRKGSDPTRIEYFKDIVATIREPLVVLDADLRVLSANRSFYKFFKVKPGETVGNLVYDLGNRQWDIPALRTLLETILPQKAVFNDYEVEHEFPTIGRRVLLLNARRIPGPPKEPLWILVAFEDVTERKRGEESLRESEEKHRTLFEKMAQGVVYHDADGKIISANPAAARILGLSFDQIQGRTSRDPRWKAIHEDGSDFRGDAHPSTVALLTGKEVYNVVMGVFNPEMEDYRWINIIAIPQFRLGETVPFRVFTTFEDITERKRIVDKMEEERILLLTLMDNLPDRIYVMDAQGRKILSNLADWRASGGKRMEDVIGKTDLETYPPELAKEYWALDKTVIDTGISIINREEPGLDSLGNPVWVLSSKVPLHDSQGKVVGLVGIGRDITARRQAERVLEEYNTRLETDVRERTRELREAQEQLVRKEKLALLGKVAGDMGHELRNPLGVISSAIYYLKLVQPDANDKVREYHALIEREVHNSEKIITDLLDFAHIECIQQEEVDVLELLRRVLVRYPVPESVTAALKVSPALPMVFADPLQMEQVLGNLLVNAYQSMATTDSATGVAQGGRLTILARLVVPAPARGRQKKMVAIVVKDNGAGITPENMKKSSIRSSQARPRASGWDWPSARVWPRPTTAASR